MTSKFSKSSPGVPSSSDIVTAHVKRFFRLGTGNVAVDGAGNVTSASGMGGFGDSSTGVFHLKPVNFGQLADLSTYFGMWKLHWLKIHYVSDMRIVTTASGTALVPGVLTVAIFDDPGRVYSSAPTTGQVVGSRTYIERALDTNWTLEYRPKGPQSRWLETSSGSTTDSSTLRQSSAGWLTFASSVPSSLVSGTVGRLYCEYEVSFQGTAAGITPTLVESKTAAAAPPVDNDKTEYELVRIPAVGRGAGAATAASVPSTPSSGLGFAFAQTRRA